MSKNIEIVQSYFNALSQGDFQTLSSLLSNDLIWHQPGKGMQSGTYVGKANVLAHLGNFAKWSEGNFAIDGVEYITDNGDFVVAPLHFKGNAKGKSLSMKGVDLFRVEKGLISEVWLFSEKIEEEDYFWTTLAG